MQASKQASASSRAPPQHSRALPAILGLPIRSSTFDALLVRVLAPTHDVFASLVGGKLLAASRAIPGLPGLPGQLGPLCFGPIGVDACVPRTFKAAWTAARRTKAMLDHLADGLSLTAPKAFLHFCPARLGLSERAF